MPPNTSRITAVAAQESSTSSPSHRVHKEEKSKQSKLDEMRSSHETELKKYEESERMLKIQLKLARERALRYQEQLYEERLYRRWLEGKLEALIGDVGTERRANSQQELSYLRQLHHNQRNAREIRERQLMDLPQSEDELRLLCLQLRDELRGPRSSSSYERFQEPRQFIPDESSGNFEFLQGDSVKSAGLALIFYLVVVAAFLIWLFAPSTSPRYSSSFSSF